MKREVELRKGEPVSEKTLYRGRLGEVKLVTYNSETSNISEEAKIIAKRMPHGELVVKLRERAPEGIAKMIAGALQGWIDAVRKIETEKFTIYPQVQLTHRKRQDKRGHRVEIRALGTLPPQSLQEYIAKLMAEHEEKETTDE